LDKAQRVRIASGLVAGALLLATTTAAVTYAASSGRGVKACASRKGDLALLNAKGKCRSGYTKTTLGAKGAAGPKGTVGARGPAGERGPKGEPGVAGPGEVVSLDAAFATDQTDSTLPLGTIDGVTLALQCFTGGADINVADGDAVSQRYSSYQGEALETTSAHPMPPLSTFIFGNMGVPAEPAGLMAVMASASGSQFDEAQISVTIEPNRALASPSTAPITVIGSLSADTRSGQQACLFDGNAFQGVP
jgi:hypothetical protein